MTQAEFEAALKAAFEQCQSAGCPLDFQQKRILLAALGSEGSTPDTETNPLDELTGEQRRSLLAFVTEQESQGKPWKIQLLDDWLQGQESGAMQFIRDSYGFQWLDRVQTVHLAEYAEDALLLKLGDRIEVANNLWEWVQDEGPCSREWVSCLVVGITEAHDNTPSMPASYQSHTNCIVRFDNGTEYEVQGVYEWNRYNWRWERG